MLENKIKLGSILSIQPQRHSQQPFQGFVCSVSQINKTTAYKTLKELTCTVLHPITRAPGLDVTIHFDPSSPHNGFLKKDASLMPVEISFS